MSLSGLAGTTLGCEFLDHGLGQRGGAVSVVVQGDDDEAGALIGEADELCVQPGPATAVPVDPLACVLADAEGPCVVELCAVVQVAGRLQECGDAQFVAFKGLVPAEMAARQM